MHNLNIFYGYHEYIFHSLWEADEEKQKLLNSEQSLKHIKVWNVGWKNWNRWVSTVERAWDYNIFSQTQVVKFIYVFATETISTLIVESNAEKRAYNEMKKHRLNVSEEKE